MSRIRSSWPARPAQFVASYDALGIAFGDAEANAAADAAAVEREDGVGAHRYQLADFGLDPAEIRPAVRALFEPIPG